MIDNAVSYIKNDSKSLLLTLVINNICTNKCRYCPPSLWSGTNHHYEQEKLLSFIKRLQNTYPSITCSISGGEPTVSPFFPDLVKTIYDGNGTTTVTTNGARTKKYWDRVAPYCGHISWSYHCAMLDEAKEDEWVDKVVYCQKYTGNSIRVMMDSDRWDRCVAFWEKLKRLGTISFEAVRIYEEQANVGNCGANYTPEMEEWLQKNSAVIQTAPGLHAIKDKRYRAADISSTVYRRDGSVEPLADLNKLVMNQENDFRGWACNIGLESLFIHFNGYVKKGNCFQGGDLFHINDHESYRLPDSAEICTQTKCLCTTDVNITKFPIFDKNTGWYKEKFGESKIFQPHKVKSEYDLDRRIENIIRLKNI